MPINILFSLSSMETHVEMYEPVVNHLRQRYSDIICNAVSSTEFQPNRAADREKLSSVFNHVWTIADDPIIRVIRKFLKKDHKILAPVKIIVRNLFVRYVRRSIKQFLAVHKPDAVILANDRSFPVVDLIQLAKNADIPTLLMQESIRKDESFPKKGLMHGQGGCDRIAAWGETSRNYFIRVGVNPMSVAVTGNPRIDNFVIRCCGLSCEKLRERFGIPGNARVILLATNPVHHTEMSLLTKEQYYKSIFTVAETVSKSSEEIFLLIKPHLIERTEHRDLGLDQKIKSFPRAVYDSSLSLAEAVVMSDAVLIFNSTVAVEAAVMNKEVGVLNLFDVNMGVDFAKEGIAASITSKDSLQNFIIGNHKGESCYRQAREKLAAHIGNSAEIIADEIISLIKV